MRLQTSGSHPKQQFVAAHFTNGTQLCLVRESSCSKPKLLFWNGSTASIRPSFKIDGCLYNPLHLSRNLLRNLRLPSPPKPYGSVKKVVEGIARHLRQRAYLKDEQARLLAYCCVASWFPEYLDPAPCLSINSPIGRDRVLILQLLKCFCRHAVGLGPASAESLLRVAPEVHPTLLVNYSKVPQKVQGLVNAGCYRGMPIPRATGELVDFFGMKVLASTALATKLENAVSLSIPLRQNGPTPSWDDAGREQLASEFQGQLLRYRLERLKEVATSDWDVPEFVSPVREIASSLGRCLCSAELRDDLVNLLREQEEEVRAAWSVEDSAIAIEGLLLACHDPQPDDDAQNESQRHKDRVHVGEAAEIANGILKLRGEQPYFTARGIGEILRAVGLPTRRLDKAGRGWRLDEKTRAKIHELARNYGVRSISQALQGCPHCKMLGGTAVASTRCT